MWSYTVCEHVGLLVCTLSMYLLVLCACVYYTACVYACMHSGNAYMCVDVIRNKGQAVGGSYMYGVFVCIRSYKLVVSVQSDGRLEWPDQL